MMPISVRRTQTNSPDATVDPTLPAVPRDEVEGSSVLSGIRKRAKASDEDFMLDSSASEAGPKPAKRRRTGAKAKEAKTHTGTSLIKRKQGRLSALPSMPLDVLYEIFSHFLPGDLVSLGRVNKAFRQVLLSQDSRTLWKNSFKVQPHMPPCPEDMSEPAWANLLFGGSNCSVCAGKTGRYKIFYELRRRLCKSCLEAHLETFNHDVLSNSTAKLLGVDVWKLFSFLPCVLARTRASRHDMYHWWRDDMIQLRAEIENLRAKHEDEEAFRAAVEIWKPARLAMMDARNEHLSMCNRIEYNRANDRSAELDKIRNERLNEIARRLKAAGYEDVDIYKQDIISHREVTAPKTMTDRVWKRVSPILEAIFKNVRSERLVQEKLSRRQKREDCFKKEYMTFLSLDTKPDIVFMPRDTEILQLSAVAALMQDDVPVSEDLQAKIRVFISSDLPSLIKDWVDRRKQFLRSSIPPIWIAERLAGNCGSESNLMDGAVEGNPHYLNISGYLQDLNLVAYVFRCFSGGRSDDEVAHFGLDALAHTCIRRGARTLQPCEKGRAVVLQLLGLVGLDSSCTTPLDMDKSNLLFVCTECSLLSNTSSDAIPTPLPWRHCLEHSLQKHNGKPTWRLLTEDERALVQLCPRSPHILDTNWGCCHCSANLDKQPYKDYTVGALPLWFRQASVVQHLASKHGVQTPIEGRDMFYNRAYWRSAPRYLPLANGEASGTAHKDKSDSKRTEESLQGGEI